MIVMFDDENTRYGMPISGYQNSIGSWFKKEFTTEEGRARRDARRNAKTSIKESEAEYKSAVSERLRNMKQNIQDDSGLYLIGAFAVLVVGGISIYAISKSKKKKG